MAPENLSDDALLDLVKKNGPNSEDIKAAIVALWNEEPIAEWISTDKKKLKKTPTQPERAAGRGRGRSAPPGRGEGGRGGRGPGRSASISTAGVREKVVTPKADTANSSPKVEKIDSNEVQVEQAVPAPEAPPVVEAPIVKSVPAAPVWGSGISLAKKLRDQELAALAPPPPAPVVEPTPEPESTPAPVSNSPGQSKRSTRGGDYGGRGRGRSKRGGRDHHVQLPKEKDIVEESSSEIAVEEVIEEIQNVTLEKSADEVESLPAQNDPILSAEIETAHHVPAMPDIVMMSPVRPTSEAAIVVGSPVVKMGRWGAPIESSESSFQFGSFGNMGNDAPSGTDTDGDESPHKIASGLISSLAESQSTWGQQAQLDQASLASPVREAEAVSASLSVWGNQSQNDTTDDTYGYDQQVSNSANDASAHSAPPGLGLGLGGLDSSVVSQSGSNKSGGNNRNSNRSAPGQPRKSDIDSNISRQPQQPYYQQVPPPGIPIGGFLPYGYGFDMNPALQPPSTGYGTGTQASSSTSPGAPGTNASGQSVNANGSSSAQNANTTPKYPPGPPGMPAQMGAPYPPYYGNPYYQQAFYYGGAQPQNFYGRGGQGMYPPRPYGADPYGPQGMGGYDMYQPGQFDAYGQMPMPQHMQVPGSNDRQSTGKSGNKNVNAQNSQQSTNVAGVPGGPPGVSGQPDANQAVHSGYGMGGYNAYGRGDQGAGWGPYQAGWGQMMPFAPGVGVGAGYSPMGGIPPQQGNNRHDQSRGGSYNNYRGGGNSTNGAGDSAGSTIGSAGAGTTSTW